MIAFHFYYSIASAVFVACMVHGCWFNNGSAPTSPRGTELRGKYCAHLDGTLFSLNTSAYVAVDIDNDTIRNIAFAANIMQISYVWKTRLDIKFSVVSEGNGSATLVIAENESSGEHRDITYLTQLLASKQARLKHDTSSDTLVFSGDLLGRSNIHWGYTQMGVRGLGLNMEPREFQKL